MAHLDAAFLRWQRRARSQALLYRFTLAIRVLLAVGFIPTGMVKLLGLRFTTMSPEYPIGALFETLYQSGPYWHFLGLGQVLAGVCVLIPATATLGAVMFFPIILNVFVITLSYDFNFTPLITGLMLLASIYLLCWDYDRLRGILGVPLPRAPAPTAGGGDSLPMPQHRLGRVEWVVYVVGTAAALTVLTGQRGLLPQGRVYLWLLLLGAVCALVALGFALVRRREAPSAIAASGTHGIPGGRA